MAELRPRHSNVADTIRLARVEENLDCRPKPLSRSVFTFSGKCCVRSALALRRQGGVMSRQPTEAVALDLQGTIESSAHVLERDNRGQVDDLLGIEMALEFLEDLVGNVDRGQRHLFCIAERGALGRREQWILGVVREGGELLLAKSDSAATGSVDVYSEDAADHLRRAQTDHPLQRLGSDLGAFDRLHEHRHPDRDAGAIRPRLVGSENLADLPLHHPGQRLQQPAELIFFERFNTHWNDSSYAARARASRISSD
jgi:hypothetical protein